MKFYLGEGEIGLIGLDDGTYGEFFIGHKYRDLAFVLPSKNFTKPRSYHREVELEELEQIPNFDLLVQELEAHEIKLPIKKKSTELCNVCKRNI